jgi:hypothetical protein
MRQHHRHRLHCRRWPHPKSLSAPLISPATNARRVLPPEEANLIRHWPKPPSRLQNTHSRRSDSQSHPQILRHRHRQLRVMLAPVFPASSRSDLPSIEATDPSLHAKDLMPMANSLCSSLAAAGSSVTVDRPAESWAQDQRRSARSAHRISQVHAAILVNTARGTKTDRQWLDLIVTHLCGERACELRHNLSTPPPPHPCRMSLSRLIRRELSRVETMGLEPKTPACKCARRGRGRTALNRYGWSTARSELRRTSAHSGGRYRAVTTMPCCVPNTCSARVGLNNGRSAQPGRTCQQPQERCT